MIYIGLPFKVVLRSELENVAKNLSLPYDDLELVLSYYKFLNPTLKTSKKFLNYEEWEEVKFDLLTTVKRSEDFLGSRGIINYGETHNVEVPCVECVYIPGFVWNSFRTKERNDLSKFLQRLEQRVNRYRKMVELGAPEIILRNSAKMVEDALNQLSDNSGKYGLEPKMKDDEKTRYKSLKDVHYDISNYTWIDLESSEDGVDPDYDPYNVISVPKYTTPENMKDTTDLVSMSLKLHEEDTKQIQQLQDKIATLESNLRSEKDRCNAIKAERDKTVQSLSKENLKLDHRIGDLIEKIHNIQTS